MNPTRLLILIAAVFAVVLAGAAGGNAFLAKYNSAVADARAARAEVARATHAADSAAAIAASLRTQATALTEAEHAAVARANAVAQTVQHLKGSLAALAQSAPDTCQPIVVVADSTIAAQDSVVADLRAGIVRADSAKADLAFALDTTLAAMKKLRGAATNLSHADAMLEKHSRPNLFLRLLPKPSLGITYGVDPAGSAHAVLGLHLGWTL